MNEPPSPINHTPGPLESAQAPPIPESDATIITTQTEPQHGRTVDPFGLRTLIIAWCLWLLIAWSLTLAIDTTVHAVRWVIFSATFGLMAVWPALRLSQQLHRPQSYLSTDRMATNRAANRADAKASARTRVLATLLDWVCLLTVFQVVIWPLMLVGGWSAQQTLFLDLAVMSWSLLAGALIGFGRVLPGAWARLTAMLLCVLLVVGEPAWMALSGTGFADLGLFGPDWQMRISPIQVLWELSTTGKPYDPSGWVPAIISTAVAAGLAWLVLAGVALLIRDARSSHQGSGTSHTHN